MTALYVGGTGSFVGEQEVGGSGFIHTASGSITFTGTAPNYILTHKATSGSVAFSGHAPLEGKRSTSGSVTFTGQLGKHYTKAYGGALAFSGAAATNISGSISFRGTSGGITFEGTTFAFKSKEYNTSLVDTYYIGEGYIGGIQVGGTKSVNSLIFTGTTLKKSQSTKIADGVLNFSIITSPVSRKRVVVATSGILFEGAAAVQRTVRSNIWEIKDAFITGVDEGNSSIWEADAVLDAATAPALPAVIAASVNGSDNIWGTA